MGYQRTCVILKPDAVQSRAYALILTRLAAELRLTGCYMRRMSDVDVVGHYAEHIGADFFAGLAAFMTSAPSLICLFEGDDAVAIARRICLETRQAFAATLSGPRNLIHASDSLVSSDYEVNFWFDNGPGRYLI